MPGDQRLKTDLGPAQVVTTDHTPMCEGQELWDQVSGQPTVRSGAQASGPGCSPAPATLTVGGDPAVGQHHHSDTSDTCEKQHVNNNYTADKNSHYSSDSPDAALHNSKASSDLVDNSPKLQGKQISGTQFSFTSIDSDRQDKNVTALTKRKGSVSNLIARFEASSRSTTPERSLTPDSHRSLRSATPDRSITKQNSLDSNTSNTETGVDDLKTIVKDTGARPKVPQNKNKSDKKEADAGSNTNEPNETLISNETERAELRGLKEFTQKYLKEQQAKNATGDGAGLESNPDINNLESDLEDLELDPDMPPTIRRNSGGAYTSYVFISSDPSNDDVASVVSSNGSYTDPENRVTVNVKETAVSPNTCVVSIQDGRTSNISIVSTESSELNSPRQSPTSLDEPPPELPTKVKVGGAKSHSELQQIVYATRESLRDFSHRSRGGEADYDRDFIDDDPDRERSGQSLNRMFIFVFVLILVSNFTFFHSQFLEMQF